MILLADSMVAIPEIAIDPAPAGNMVAVIRAGERGPLRDPKWDSMALNHEASVGVQTGWTCASRWP
jgi:hypothetical protein